MTNYLPDESDARILRSVVDTVRGRQTSGRANRHRPDEVLPPGGDLVFGVVQQSPNGGSGAAILMIPQINADGTWAATSETVAVICPELG